MYKSEFKGIVSKLATNDQNDKVLLLTLKFWPQEFVCPCLVEKKLKKKRVEIVFKLATNGQSDKGFFLTWPFVPKGLYSPA